MGQIGITRRRGEETFLPAIIVNDMLSILRIWRELCEKWLQEMELSRIYYSYCSLQLSHHRKHLPVVSGFTEVHSCVVCEERLCIMIPVCFVYVNILDLSQKLITDRASSSVYL